MFSVRSNRCILGAIFISTVTILLVLYTGTSTSLAGIELIRPDNSAILDETVDDFASDKLDGGVCSTNTELITTWKTRETKFLRGVPGFSAFCNLSLMLSAEVHDHA